MIIAIDFDGTVVKNAWPQIGRFRIGARWALQILNKRGHILILNTCREGKLLNEALMFLAKNEIRMHCANCNSLDRIKEYGGDCRKISAELYLDDRGFFPGWLAIPAIVQRMELKDRLKNTVSEIIRAILETEYGDDENGWN
jgi:hypothetical protein